MVFGAQANLDGRPYTLFPSGQTIHGGSWAGIRASDGAIAWQTADPNNFRNLTTIDVAGTSCIPGIVFVSSFTPRGDLYALDMDTGAILWTYRVNTTVNSAPSIVNGKVFWGTGYQRIFGLPGNKLYAFGL